ncbi:hypothetical protein BS17DRAFT_808892 [Gyrodon lividus]|nr:hypothetical protein BS17DRAFT_808892 [Gyrodon lividus]
MNRNAEYLRQTGSKATVSRVEEREVIRDAGGTSPRDANSVKLLKVGRKARGTNSLMNGPNVDSVGVDSTNVYRIVVNMVLWIDGCRVLCRRSRRLATVATVATVATTLDQRIPSSLTATTCASGNGGGSGTDGWALRWLGSGHFWGRSRDNIGKTNGGVERDINDAARAIVDRERINTKLMDEQQHANPGTRWKEDELNRPPRTTSNHIVYHQQWRPGITQDKPSITLDAFMAYPDALLTAVHYTTDFVATPLHPTSPFTVPSTD